MAEAGRWKPYVQRQGQLLPTFVEDTLDPSDPVFFIDDAVDSLDLTPFEQRYAETGEHAYAPRLLLKLWLYAATQGVFSVIRRLNGDLPFVHWHHYERVRLDLYVRRYGARDELATRLNSKRERPQLTLFAHRTTTVRPSLRPPASHCQ